MTGRPERLNLHVLAVLCDLLDCTPNDLITVKEASGHAYRFMGVVRTSWGVVRTSAERISAERW